MDIFLPDSHRDINYHEMGEWKHFFMHLVFLFQFCCLLFNVLLLFAAHDNRRVAFLPIPYIIVMSLTGILVCVLMNVNLLAFMYSTKEDYEEYIVNFGPIVTLGSTFTYFFSILITVLMTVNRLVIVIKPLNNYFTPARVYLYCGIIAAVVLTSLLVPFYSPCYVTFTFTKMAFISACAPDKHPITLFQNEYAILLPLSCMLTNLGIIIHLRLARNGMYPVIKRMFCKKNEVLFVDKPFPKPTHQSKMRARRDYVMMRQTVSIAIYLSIYESGAFLTRMFPDAYASLPDYLRDFYFFFRMESIAFMNVFIYFIETASTRRMIRRYLNLNNSESTVRVATVTPARIT
ncbi:CBN-SRXA-8 protein [Caenorhabditis brenneri]|uniref:CBN-SRXA-8 protein n=1 Tax=Caenorhabditis brenneri TaxID=135651 RepID=G0MAQ2_CAEBE|nr:CBN-SRXA-8 protein [Caenorhabditis brenneri]